MSLFLDHLNFYCIFLNLQEADKLPTYLTTPSEFGGLMFCGTLLGNAGQVQVLKT